MAKTFILDIERRGARPRSRRLREAGGWGGGARGVFAGRQNGVETPLEGNRGDGHTHANKEALDMLGVTADDYVTVTRWRETEAGQELGAEKIKAGRADEAGHAEMAHDLDADSPANERFVSSVEDDVAEGRIRMAQGVTLGDGAQWGLLPDGGARLESLVVGVETADGGGTAELTEPAGGGGTTLEGVSALTETGSGSGLERAVTELGTAEAAPEPQTLTLGQLANVDADVDNMAPGNYMLRMGNGKVWGVEDASPIGVAFINGLN